MVKNKDTENLKEILKKDFENKANYDAIKRLTEK